MKMCVRGIDMKKAVCQGYRHEVRGVSGVSTLLVSTIFQNVL
jgi:hypothetical protein